MKVIERIACKFGRNDVRTVRFNANDRRVRVTCKGLPALTVKEIDGKFQAICKVTNKKGLVSKEFVEGKTAEQAYKRALRQFWKDQA